MRILLILVAGGLSLASFVTAGGPQLAAPDCAAGAVCAPQPVVEGPILE